MLVTTTLLCSPFMPVMECALLEAICVGIGVDITWMPWDTHHALDKNEKALIAVEVPLPFYTLLVDDLALVVNCDPIQELGQLRNAILDRSMKLHWVHPSVEALISVSRRVGITMSEVSREWEKYIKKV